MPFQTKNDDKKPTSTPSGKVVDTITNVGAAALIAKGAKKMYDKSKISKDLKDAKPPEPAFAPKKTPPPAPPTTKKESVPATGKKAPAPAPKKTPAPPTTKKESVPKAPKAPAPAPAPKAPAPAPSAKPSIWAKWRNATKAGAGAGSVPKASKDIGRSVVGDSLKKGGAAVLGAVKRNPRIAAGAALITAASLGIKYLKNRKAKNQEQPESTVSMTERMKTQSDAQANNPSETPKPVSRSESKYPVYKKDSEEAKDFRANFAKARKEQGKDGTFEWQGRKYNTKLKGE